MARIDIDAALLKLHGQPRCERTEDAGGRQRVVESVRADVAGAFVNFDVYVRLCFTLPEREGAAGGARGPVRIRDLLIIHSGANRRVRADVTQPCHGPAATAASSRERRPIRAQHQALVVHRCNRSPRRRQGLLGRGDRAAEHPQSQANSDGTGSHGRSTTVVEPTGVWSAAAIRATGRNAITYSRASSPGSATDEVVTWYTRRMTVTCILRRPLSPGSHQRVPESNCGSRRDTSAPTCVPEKSARAGLLNARTRPRESATTAACSATSSAALTQRASVMSLINTRANRRPCCAMCSTRTSVASS